MPAVQLAEVVGLQAHVVEFEEAELLVAVEPHLHAVHRQHAVDREVPADVAQEVDVVEGRQPLGIVDHQGVAAGLAEVQQAREALLQAVLVGRDGVEGEDLPRLVPPGGIADARRTAAHQNDGAVAGLLQPVQHHDGHQAAHVQGRGRAVVADIGRQAALGGERRDAGGVGRLMQVAARGHDREEIGSGRRGRRHDGSFALGSVRLDDPPRIRQPSRIVGQGRHRVRYPPSLPVSPRRGAKGLIGIGLVSCRVVAIGRPAGRSVCRAETPRRIAPARESRI